MLLEKVVGQEIVQQLCIQMTTCQWQLYTDIQEELQVICSIDSAKKGIIQNSVHQPNNI